MSCSGNSSFAPVGGWGGGKGGIFKVVAFPVGLVLVVNCTSEWETLNCAVKFWWKNAFMSSVLKCRAISDVDDTSFIIQNPNVAAFTRVLTFTFPAVCLHSVTVFLSTVQKTERLLHHKPLSGWDFRFCCEIGTWPVYSAFGVWYLCLKVFVRTDA